ncbi:Heterokaryon incompatibility protein 6,OR allele [Lachnellula hyalina]|uniref:Heterokaryon incompatibility protein 6,OR allele n=1 Tax=Lachnellula hyalina TaxID=1316788 RepID=A0A8H8RAH6_9HELO|nr:Heterokaryon incompatibility protein 6,OR allele [Lachnellula hyalina]TVY30682.1 Heterokaryon incompatibility protein 6,OR allele [Lachnellula hyalina]
MKKTSRKSTFNTDVGTQKFTYKPLSRAQDSIRLLRLKPAANPNSLIHCSLFHTSLSEAPPYVALSYCWGERAGAQQVYLEDELITVTPNLKQALQRLRPPSGEDLVLWVDAICINQSDIHERSIQTSNMRSVYKSAESVAVWLGLEYRKSSEAIQFARDLAACDEGAASALVRDPAREEHLEALVTLFRRQYWWRIWVIQEVACGRSTTVYCGADAIEWRELNSVCDIFKKEEGHLRDFFYNRPSYGLTLIRGGPRSLQLSRYSPDLVAPPLLELLLSHKSKMSTDPKDKVSHDTFGALDYSLSMRDVYTHTARHIISTSRKLDVICVKQHDVSRFNLPSWAPDWTRPPANSGSSVVGLQHHEPEFAAAGNSLAQFEFLNDGYVLKAAGLIVSTIAILGMPFKQKVHPRFIEPALHAFNEWWNLFASALPESSSLPAQAAFSRAISCGNWMFEDEGVYENKLRAIFELSGSILADEDVLPMDAPQIPSLSGSVTSLMSENEIGEFDDARSDKEQRAVIINASITMNRRRLFISQTGIVGLCPWNAAVGDVICVLLGCRFPVILRPVEGKYKLVGEAYVDGLMNGEAMALLEKGRYTLEGFEIH